MKKTLLTFAAFLISTHVCAQTTLGPGTGTAPPLGSGVGVSPSDNAPVGGFPESRGPGPTTSPVPLNDSTIDEGVNQFPSIEMQERMEESSNLTTGGGFGGTGFGTGVGTGIETGTGADQGYYPGTQLDIPPSS